MIRQALAKGLALPRPRHRLFQADPAQRFHGSSHGHALAIEVGHDHQEALVFFADEVAHGHPHIVKVQGRGIRRPPALLPVQLGAAETLRIGGNQQHGNTPAPSPPVRTAVDTQLARMPPVI